MSTMSTLSNLVTWTPVYYEKPKWIKPVITAFIIGASLLAVSIALKSNTVRAALPSTVQGYLLNLEETLANAGGGSGDTVVLTKHIKGRKLLKKTAGLHHHPKGLVSYQYEKKFRLRKGVVAVVAVDRFVSKSEAIAASKLLGGNKEDQLGIGRPSFMEIHGLDKKNNYYLRGVARDGENLVTVTLIRKLDDREQQAALGSRYDAMMEEFFQQHFERVQGIAGTQVKRLTQSS